MLFFFAFFFFLGGKKVILKIYFPKVNHLGPLLFTLELLPVLLATAGSSKDVRVLFVTSDGHFKGVFNPNGELNELKADQYGRMGTYLNTKLYNVSRKGRK